MSDIGDWSTTAASNDSSPPNGWPEGMNRSDVNNAAREMMASLRAWYDAPEFVDLFADQTVTKDSATVVRVAGRDVTSYCPANRRVMIVGDTTVYGFVASSAYSSPDTTITVDVDSLVAVPANTAQILMAGAASLARSAYTASGGSMDILEIQLFM